MTILQIISEFWKPFMNNEEKILVTLYALIVREKLAKLVQKKMKSKNLNFLRDVYGPIYFHTHKYDGSTRGVMAMIVKMIIGDPSSNPAGRCLYFHSANTTWKGMNPSISV